MIYSSKCLCVCALINVCHFFDMVFSFERCRFYLALCVHSLLPTLSVVLFFFLRVLFESCGLVLVCRFAHYVAIHTWVGHEMQTAN